MIQLFEALRPNDMRELLNTLGPLDEVLSIYAMNGRHFAWVRKVVKADPQSKKSKKGVLDGDA